MIIATTVVIIITILLFLIITIIIIIIIIINNINSDGSINKNQVILLKKYFLKLCLKVFKLSVCFNVSGIWFQNEGPIKDKTFYQRLHFGKVVPQTSITFGRKFKNFIQVVRTTAIDKFKHDWNNTLFKPSNDWQPV